MLLLVYFHTALLLIFLIDYLKWGIGPNPTSRVVTKQIVEHLPPIEGLAADLGSGFGTFAFSLSKKLSGSLVGYEGAQIPYWISKFLSKIFIRPNLKIQKGDFFKEDLSSYQIVFCYLYRSAMPKLTKKLQEELKAGSWVITHTFALDQLKPDKVIRANDLYQTPIYFYQIKK